MKYGIPNVNMLSSWLCSCLTPLEIHEKCASLPLESVQEEKMEKDLVDQSALVESLQKQVSKLEKDLRRSQDKVIALNTLIDIAEEQGIHIRKKSGAKQ